MFAPPALAGTFDPVPVLKDLPASPPQDALFRAKAQDFFCPLIKKFYNDPEEIAAQTLMLEALGEGYDGMVAVGEVIRNRTKLFLKNPSEICRMKKQFSCWNDERKAREFLEKNKAYYFIALTAWRASERSALTGGATDYHAVYVRPYWAEAYRVAARIGRHIFYVRK